MATRRPFRARIRVSRSSPLPHASPRPPGAFPVDKPSNVARPAGCRIGVARGAEPTRGAGLAGKVHNSAVARQTLVGRVGTVATGIRGGDLAGEVRVVVEGIAHYYLAYAVTALPAGTSVLVIHNRGARQIDVEPWPTVPPDETAGGVEEGL